MHAHRWPWILVALVLCLLPWPARAHTARTSAVWLSFGDREAAAELQVPVDQLEMALRRPLERAPEGLADAERLALASYLAQHVGMTTAGGEALAVVVDVDELGLEQVDGAESLRASLRLTAPPGASLEALELRYDVVLHRVVTHEILVVLRRDVARGILDAAPQTLGTLRYQHTVLTIDRAGAGTGAALASMVSLGMRHIAEGSDHLLFVLLLLLPAPLVARRRSWAGSRPLADTLRGILVIVTAFTVGHSLTLAAAVLGVLRLPSEPVEVLIAGSVLVSAIHAATPVSPRREGLVAAGLGLVHGLGFSTVLAELGLRGVDLGLGLVGFNLGIELMQIGVVVLVAPWILLLARSPAFLVVRLGCAAAGGAVAVSWIGERALGLHDPLGPLVDRAFAHPLLAVGALAAVAIAATGAGPRGRALVAKVGALSRIRS